MAFPKIPDRDMAVVFKIHVGLTRDNKMVLESDSVENVLGDVPHRRCIEAFAAFAQHILEGMITQHLGEEGIKVTEEEVKEHVKSVVDDFDLSFFDQNVEISDE